MLTYSTLQRAFPLIYGLHPNRTVAICILIEACEWISRLRYLQRRRHGYKLQTPEAGLIQFSVYSISERWEKDQESECPTKQPVYKPTSNDRLVRYVKALALKSMDWRSLYAAVAVGCLLYRYHPHEVSLLAEDVFKSDNIRRVKSKMIEFLKERFTGKNELSNGNGELQFEIPNDHQRTLIKTSLCCFAPWNCCSPTQSDSLLETYFDKCSDKTEWERLHVLFDCACGGFPRLVNEYNSIFSKGNEMLLDDPEHKLGSPKFNGDSQGPTGGGGGEPPEPPDRFNPAPLTDDELAIIRHALERNERRRNKFRASELRVLVDGEEIATVTPSTHEAFAIPATASCIEVFGEDEDGELLLAVLPLNYGGGSADSFKQQISVMGDQRIDVSIVHWCVQPKESSEPNDESLENLVLLNYSERFNQEATNTIGRFGIGKLATRYRILEKISTGSRAIIYKAEDTQLKRLSAIKVFYRSETIIKKRAREIRDEIARLTSLSHPGLVKILDAAGLSESPPYLVTEYIPGISLREELSETGMELERVAELGRQIGQTLSAAHADSIFHCSLSPANILLSNTDNHEHVKIIDFGLTKLLFDKTGADPPWHSVEADAGSVYMAPEQFYRNECSVRSDVYAMGAILYEMVTGQSPFPADSLYRLIMLKREEIKGNLCDLRRGLPQSAQSVILKALAFEPEDRYGSAQELGDALAEALTAHRKTDSIKPIPARSAQTEFFNEVELRTQDQFHSTAEEPLIEYCHSDIQRRIEFEEFISSIPEAHQIAVALWMEGHSLRVIARTLSAEGMRCSHSTVHSWIKKVTMNFLGYERATSYDRRRHSSLWVEAAASLKRIRNAS